MVVASPPLEIKVLHVNLTGDLTPLGTPTASFQGKASPSTVCRQGWLLAGDVLAHRGTLLQERQMANRSDLPDAVSPHTQLAKHALMPTS